MWQHFSMEIAAMMPSRGAIDLAERLVQVWVDGCNNFLHWERQEVIEKSAGPAVLAIHRQNLRVILHFGRMLHTEVADPGSELNRFAPEIAGKLLQLESSWEMIHNPMPDGEADELLQKHFPDEPESGSPA
jgi:hypothetical protein